MNRCEKIDWMNEWCDKHELSLVLNGSCGIGRECVGVSSPINHCYPDYEWYDKETWERIDNNGNVWRPKDAYHKHPCVAVLGRGEEAEDQLYRWLKWFDENGFVVKTIQNPNWYGLSEIEKLIGKEWFVRMVKER